MWRFIAHFKRIVAVDGMCSCPEEVGRAARSRRLERAHVQFSEEGFLQWVPDSVSSGSKVPGDALDDCSS